MELTVWSRERDVRTASGQEVPGIEMFREAGSQATLSLAYESGKNCHKMILKLRPGWQYHWPDTMWRRNIAGRGKSRTKFGVEEIRSSSLKGGQQQRQRDIIWEQQLQQNPGLDFWAGRSQALTEACTRLVVIGKTYQQCSLWVYIEKFTLLRYFRVPQTFMIQIT